VFNKIETWFAAIWPADLLLLFVAAIWGGTFVMVQDAVAVYPVFAFLALRFSLASLVFLPILARRRHATSQKPSPGRVSRLLPGLLIGSMLFAGYAFQTYGLRWTTPAKAGFITGLSVVMVPLGSAFFLRQRPSRAAWGGVGLATVGLALLTLNQDLRVARGDLLVLGCAIAFAVHVLLVGHFAPRLSPLNLAAGQIITVAVLAGGLGLLVGEGIPRPTGPVWFAAIFTGLLATALAFGAQTLAQRFTSPTHTALIFATEPAFAALFSFLLIGEQLTPRALLGCGLILAGMITAEFRWRPQRMAASRSEEIAHAPD
jgi:drug/metabolite transporter (DMT)-like permease